SLGHEYGDTLLQHVAERLEKLTRVTDTVSRLGGDEFIILLDDIKEENQPAHLAERIITSFGNPFVISDQIFHMGTSIGIALYPVDGTDSVTLIRNADTAMYKAKEEGRQRYRHFTNALNERVAKRLRVETDLRIAIVANQFEVFYQPKLDLASGKITGFEGLARWRKNGIIIPPADFIPLAEETGLIPSLDRIMLELGCTEIAHMNLSGGTVLKLAMNASAQTIRKKSYPDEIKEVFLRSGMKPEWMEIEITESDVMKDLDESITVINRIVDMGISIAIDDFGIGYSSLSQLSRIPADTLKIDKSFVDMIDGCDSVSIIETIHAMARDRHMKTVAEGVETEKQFAYLKNLGCDAIQGYIISRPVPFDEL
ncbi:MAG: putative bifunctional diguanylate cyclase/phosphodiesterase, partial [Spirochaetota bacterium]